MAKWQLQDAKARFSELIDTTLSQGPQIVTKRGIETAVVVSIVEWNRLQTTAPNIKDILVGPGPRDIPIPKRGKFRLRPPVALE